MRRIDTATKAVDLFGAGKHGFKNGDPALAILATKLNAEFFNAMQEELAGIVEAAGLALSGGDNTQLLQALRAAGVFQTQAQFDFTTKAATTAFVQRALGSFSGIASIASNTALTAAFVGCRVNVSPGVTATLPPASGVAMGAAILFAGDGIFTPAAGDTLYDLTGVAVSNTNIGYGVGLADFTHVIRTSSSSWQVFGGAGSLKFSPAFQKSFVANGYQKLPSGLIVQWGTGTTSGAGVATVTYPVAFPTACLNLACSARRASALSNSVGSNGTFGASSSTVYAASATATGFDYLAIGY